MAKSRLMVKALTWLANRTKEAKDFMEAWDATVQFEIGDEERFFVQIKDGKIAFFDGRSEKPDVTIKSDPEYFTKILVGEMDTASSVVSGTRYSEGLNTSIQTPN